jgi:hypothetical protein
MSIFPLDAPPPSFDTQKQHRAQKTRDVSVIFRMATKINQFFKYLFKTGDVTEMRELFSLNGRPRLRELEH